jgi:hypothetical protein
LDYRRMTAAERYLLKCAETGTIARFGASAYESSADVPATNDGAISADVLRDLIAGAGAALPIGSSGIQVAGARIIGTLDLAAIRVGFPRCGHDPHNGPGSC